MSPRPSSRCGWVGTHHSALITWSPWFTLKDRRGTGQSQGGSTLAGQLGEAMLQSVSVVTIVFGVGYLGSRLVQELLFQGRDVIGFDNLFSTDRRAIDSFLRSPTFQFVEADLLDPAAVDRTIGSAGDQVDAVYLLAAQSSSHPDAADEEYTELVNLRGPRLVLDVLVDRRIAAPVVFGSSIRVYGASLPPEVDETTPYGTFTDLAHLTKCYAEKLLEMYACTRGVTSRVVRLGLTYGVAPVLKTDRRFMTAPNLFCLQAARGEPLVVRSAQPVALAHVDDVARSLLWVSEATSVSGYSVYNLATAVATIRTIAEIVADVARERELPPVELIGPPQLDVEAPAPVIHSALSSAGFRPRRQLREGLAETLDHFSVREAT
jgi:nucleoside-diphosphate-sugar epimerase